MQTYPAEMFKQTLHFLNVPDMDVKRLKEGFKEYNKSWGPSSKMSAEMRRYLTEFYAPHNAHLYELLGRDFGWE